MTVVFRGPAVPGIGRLDITAEALAYGAVLGLRAVAIIACAALLSGRRSTPTRCCARCAGARCGSA